MAPPRQSARPGFEALHAELQKDVIHPAYLLWGEETFLIQRAVQEIIKTALGSESDTFNLSRYQSENHRLGEAVAASIELPMLAARRVVVFERLTLRDAYGYAKIQARKPDRDRLAAYLADPSPSTVLVLTGDVADYKQRALTGAKSLHVFDMTAPSEMRLLRWIPKKAEASGVQIGLEAARELLELTGPSMTRLGHEIEKLSLYAGSGNEATPEAVRALVEGSSEESVFEVSNAIGAGDLPKALRVSRRIVAVHTDGDLRLVNELRRSFTLWLRIRSQLDRGEAPGAIAGHLKLPTFLVRRNLEPARRFSQTRLGALLGCVQAAERATKGGPGDSRTVVEEAILSAAGSR
jgi:DNA polymerase-3 subunit delta